MKYVHHSKHLAFHITLNTQGNYQRWINSHHSRLTRRIPEGNLPEPLEILPRFLLGSKGECWLDIPPGPWWGGDGAGASINPEQVSAT